MLRLGFFERFKGSDTVLLCGNAEDIAALRQRLAHLASPASEDTVAVHELCSVSAKNPAQLFALSGATGNGFVYDQDVSAKLAVLEQAVSGHQYFDLPNNRVLLVSVGEYDDRFWHTHG